MNYTGFKEIVLSNEDLAEFYLDKTINKFDCLINQYIILKNEFNETIDYYKWNGKEYMQIITKVVNNGWVDKIKSRNEQQYLALDMLYDPSTTVKVLSGGFGTGKDFLMSGVALDLIKKNKYEKIVWVRNNICVSATKEIGAIPGDVYSKLLPFVMPLADHVGGIAGLEFLIQQGKVEVCHLGFMRGRDIRNSIIYVTESENNSKQHIQLLLGRVSEGSCIWLNGDYKQCDDKIFQKDNGLMTTIDKLKGHKLFGYVHLVKNERSETANLSDLLD